MSVHNCVRQTLQQLGLKAMGSSLFGVKVYNVREHALLYFTYHCNLQDIPPSKPPLGLFRLMFFVCDLFRGACAKAIYG